MPVVAQQEVLAEAFSAAEPEHFEWQTRGAVVAERERAMVRAAFLPLGQDVLDVGCGEGATLVHLDEPAGAWGVDLFESKVAFARARLGRCNFKCASVYDLPFEDRSFDHVLARDLIHHLEAPERFVSECARVLRPGGRIDVLEPCRYNPLIFLHAVTNRVERGELRSTLPYVRGLLESRFRVVRTRRYQALPLHRIVYHPKLGRPGLAEVPLARRLVDALERLAQHVTPQGVHAYFSVRAIAD